MNGICPIAVRWASDVHLVDPERDDVKILERRRGKICIKDDLVQYRCGGLVLRT